MGKQCSAYGCNRRDSDKADGIRFHRFPLNNPELLQQWSRAIFRKDWVPAAHSRICSEHFVADDYLGTNKSYRLKDFAVPSVFAAIPAHLQLKRRNPQRPKERHHSPPPLKEDSTAAEECHSVQSSSATDHLYCSSSAAQQSQLPKAGRPKRARKVLSQSTEADANEATSAQPHANQRNSPHVYPRRSMRKRPSRFEDVDDSRTIKASPSLPLDRKNVKRSELVKPIARPQQPVRRRRKVLLSDDSSAATERSEDGGCADGPNKLDILISVLQKQSEAAQLRQHKQPADNSTSSSTVRSVGVMTDKRQEVELAGPVNSVEKPPMSDLIITNLDFFIRELKRRHLLEEESAHLIHNNFDKNILVTVDNEFGQLPAKESGCVISDSVRQFLLTLYFHSPEAYEFFLKVSAVPRFSFVRAQLTNTQFHPGFFTELIENTNAKDVSLVIDRMSLRRHPVSLDEELVGFCDCGGVIAEDPNEMASEVVVFLLVTWEQVPQRFPIGYFLVHNLSAQVQAQLIESAIILADKNSLTVRNVVCDGSISNFSSLRLLGCQFDTANVVAHFKSAHGLKQLVYVTFDVNHLMTLAHNALADLGTFVTRKGERISWEYLVHLLTMGSELWSNASSDPPLMSALATANLAAHVFSSSVADALLELRYSCTPGFEECLPTAQFIHQFHEVFTILNCKSQFGQGLQSPIDPTNVLDMRATINKFTSFLLGLKTEAGIPLHKSARRTFICGLLSTCQSVLKLSDLILQMSPQVYTSSFSLEHSECFFEKICRKDDPPSAAAFKTSIKQFLNQQLVELSTPAAALDCCTSVSVVKPKWSRRCTTILLNEEKEGALDYLMGGQPLSDDDLLTVAGGIVTALSGRVSCDSCCLALVDSGCVLDSLHYARGMSSVQQALARLKRGEGQIIPSQEVFRIVQRCERVFCHTALVHLSRYASHSKLALFLSASYRRSVLEDRPLSTFTHVCVLQKGSLSHQDQLSNYIVDKFFSIRLKRFTKLHCFRMLLGPH